MCELIGECVWSIVKMREIAISKDDVFFAILEIKLQE